MKLIVCIVACCSIILQNCKPTQHKNSNNKFNPDAALTHTSMTTPIPFAEGEQPKLISDQFSFTEGPACDAGGNVFFTDQPNDKIWKYDAGGKLSVFMEKSGRSNGLYIDLNNNIISCADEHNQLWRISPNKQVTILVKDIEGKKLNGPNDVWVNKYSGHIYFTDPYYERDYWENKSQVPKGEHVYLLKKEADNVELADSFLKKPNGLIGTADGKHLYVADIGDNKTYKFDIAADGALLNRTLFTNQGSDGMTMDEEGNIYLTGNGVTIFNNKGEKIINIPINENWTANVCFGGKNMDQLFITASKSLYVMQMKVKGIR